MSERVDERSIVQLQRLDDASSSNQLELLKLGAECFGVPRKIIKTAKSFADVYIQLNDHVAKGEGLTWLYALLCVICVAHEELKTLALYINDESLKRCKKTKKYYFAVMILRVCNFFSQDDYRAFFDLCRPNLKHTLNFEKFPTIELFLMELIRQNIISAENVEVLYNKLEDMGHILAKDVVQKYREMIGNLGQETQQLEGATDAPSQTQGEYLRGCTTALQEVGEPYNHQQAQESDGDATRGTAGPDCTSAEYKQGDTYKPFIEGGREGSPNQGLSDIEKDGVPPFPKKKDDPRHDSGNVSLSHTKSSSDPKQHSHQDKDNINGTHSDYTQYQIQGDHDENTPLVGGKFSSVSYAVLKKKSCQKGLCCGTTSLLVITAIAFASSGGWGWNTVSTNINQNVVDVTKFAVRNDTLFLGTVDASWVSNATVSETIQNGDSSHISYVYSIHQEDLKKYSISEENRVQTRHNMNPSTTTYLFRDYYWDGSSFNLSFYAMNPSGSTGVGYAYLFNDEEQFENYKNGKPALPISSKQLNIGTFNVSERTLFQFKVNQPSFYFIAVETPADVYYSYLVHSKKVYLDPMDYEKSCEHVYEGSPCSLKFTKAGVYFVLAYVKPLEDEGSFTTHLRFQTGIVQSARQQIVKYKSLAFTGLGLGGLIIIGLCLLKYFRCKAYHSRSETVLHKTDQHA